MVWGTIGLVMARKKRRDKLQGKILTILTASADVLDTVGNFAYNPYPYLYSSLGDSYPRERIDEAMASLTDEGLVEGSVEEGFRLTFAGAGIKEKLYRVRQGEWDGKWRVVFFDIPEAQRKIRDDLRSELRRLGFGLWQRSAWITPFDIAKELNSYLREQDLSAVVQIMAGERLGELNDREFAAKVWPLKDINGRYTHLLAVWKKELERESEAEERLEVAATLHNRYLDILAADPQLPSELLPRDWVGDGAKKLFKRLKSTLSIRS